MAVWRYIKQVLCKESLWSTIKRLLCYFYPIPQLWKFWEKIFKERMEIRFHTKLILTCGLSCWIIPCWIILISTSLCLSFSSVYGTHSLSPFILNRMIQTLTSSLLPQLEEVWFRGGNICSVTFSEEVKQWNLRQAFSATTYPPFLFHILLKTTFQC